MTEELYNKIDKFCNETDWSKYPTYEHALEEFIKGIVAEETKELEAQIEKMKCCGNCKNEGDYKEPYRYGTGWCNICIRHKVSKGNFDKWEIKEK